MTNTNGSIKKLSLNKETIRSLTPDQLDDVAGGTTPITTVTLGSFAVSLLSALVSGVTIAYSIARMK